MSETNEDHEIPTVSLEVTTGDDGEFMLLANEEEEKINFISFEEIEISTAIRTISVEEMNLLHQHMKEVVEESCDIDDRRDEDFQLDQCDDEESDSDDEEEDADFNFKTSRKTPKSGKKKKKGKKKKEAKINIVIEDVQRVESPKRNAIKSPTSTECHKFLEDIEAMVERLPKKKSVRSSKKPRKRVKLVDDDDDDDDEDGNEGEEKVKSKLPKKEDRSTHSEVPISIEQATAEALELQPLKKQSVTVITDDQTDKQISLCRLVQSSQVKLDEQDNLHTSKFKSLKQEIMESRRKSMMQVSTKPNDEPGSDFNLKLESGSGSGRSNVNQESKKDDDGWGDDINDGWGEEEVKKEHPTPFTIPKKNRASSSLSSTPRTTSSNQRQMGGRVQQINPKLGSFKIPKKSQGSNVSGEDEEWGAETSFASNLSLETTPLPPRPFQNQAKGNAYANLMYPKKKFNIQETFIDNRQRGNENSWSRIPTDGTSHSWDAQPCTPPADTDDGWGDSSGSKNVPRNKPPATSDGWDDPLPSVEEVKKQQSLTTSVDDDDGWNSPSVSTKNQSTGENNTDDGWGEVGGSSSTSTVTKKVDPPSQLTTEKKSVHFKDVLFEDTVVAPKVNQTKVIIKSGGVEDDEDDDDIVW